jgi:hypothetical protein
MRSSHVPPRCSLRTRIRSLQTLALAALACASTGCIERPIAAVTPSTTNVSVNTIKSQGVDKIDLLFMIDNSISMADKQKTLADAIPVLVERLVTPNCLDAEGRPVGVSDTLGHCAQGKPEFRAIRDIHIGVISSSLGNRGGEECSARADDVAKLRTPDDRAELLPSANPEVRGALRSWNGSGFLAWDPGQDRNVPPGESHVTQLIDDFRSQVTAAGDRGCGYESSLEAWYRFLIDPEPPVSVAAEPNADGTFVFTRRGPVNETVLAQRKAFLRPDSLLAIVMLSDENDCSIADDDGSQGWLVSSTKLRMPRSASACKNPNDPCCHTCATAAPAGCTPNEADSECSKKGAAETYAMLTSDEDSPNLRCFSQTQRFGMDLLHPVGRYVDALTKPTVKNRAGADVPNPIFASPERMPSSNLVLLAGIVGVPWQDIATEASLTGSGLEYLTAAEIREAGRWQLILGDGQGPSDPLMRESVEPRSGTHPLLNAPLIAPGASGPRNPINGSEQNVPKRDDLQFACTYPLPELERRPCTAQDTGGCDCNADEFANQSSLCEYPNGPDTEGIQVAAKAYPGVRELEVLRGVGDNGIVASICPKNIAPAPGLTKPADPSYGYNPAIAALLEIIKERIPSQCLARALPIENDPASPEYGHVPCAVVEALPPSASACSCDPARGRVSLETANPNLRSAVEEQLTLREVCGGATGHACRDYCMCQIEQLSGERLANCQNGNDDASAFGYCYVDPEQGVGNPELVEDCTETRQRILRFVGDGLPANGSDTFIACVGSALHGGE